MSSPYRRPALAEQLRGVDQVRRAALVHVDLEVGPAPHERARSPPAWSRWMWVSSSARGRAAAERLEQRARRDDAGPGIDEHAADLASRRSRARVPRCMDVDGSRSASGPATMHRRSSREWRTHVGSMTAPPARARPAVDDADLRGPLDGARSPTSSTAQPGQGPDRPLDRVRPADADRLRRRPRARARRGRQGRRADRPQGRHARAARRHPARRDEHVDDDQRDGRLAAGALHRRRRGERRRPRRAPGHDAERHHQGVPLARDLRVPARPVDAADRRHGRLHGRATSRSGTRSTSAPTTCRRPGRRRCRRSPTRWPTRSRCSTRCASACRRDAAWARCSGASRSSSTPACASSRSTRSCARWRVLWEELGRERYGVEDAKQLPLPLRRAGQLARADRGPAGEQRAAHRARGARRSRSAATPAPARIQLPAWNEALGLPRPWDQQWSLRIQQVLAYETDLLEYPDIFEGSKVMDGLVGRAARGRARRDGASSPSTAARSRPCRT